MKFTVTIPTEHVEPQDEFVTGEAVFDLARAIEVAGFDAGNVYDHPFPTAEFVATGGHQAIDPFIGLAFAAAATSTLRLQTNILVPAYRNPFVTAHSIATLDALSGGRVLLGFAVGYLQPEFEALGVDFHRRGAILDETIALMKQAWTGEPIEAKGDGWVASGNVLRPLPITKPHPPIWFGGNSKAAIRRVVAGGQGWMPFPASEAVAEAVRTTPMADVDALAAAIGTLHEAAVAAGRTDPIDVCVTPFTHPHWRGRLDPDVLLEEAVALKAAGATWLSIRLAAPSRAAFLENVERFGKEVIDESRGI